MDFRPTPRSTAESEDIKKDAVQSLCLDGIQARAGRANTCDNRAIMEVLLSMRPALQPSHKSVRPGPSEADKELR